MKKAVRKGLRAKSIQLFEFGKLQSRASKMQCGFDYAESVS